MDYNNISILYKTNKIDQIHLKAYIYLHLYVYAWLCGREKGWKKDRWSEKG